MQLLTCSLLPDLPKFLFPSTSFLWVFLTTFYLLLNKFTARETNVIGYY